MFHAAARLAQRYGVRRHAERVVARLTGLVLHGEAKFRRPLPGGKSEWTAYVAGKRVRFVWSETARMVITVLPAKRRPPKDRPAAVDG